MNIAIAIGIIVGFLISAFGISLDLACLFIDRNWNDMPEKDHELLRNGEVLNNCFKLGTFLMWLGELIFLASLIAGAVHWLA